MPERRITVRGIIIKDSKLFCQQLKPGNDGERRDYWCTPGGGLELGESLHEGLYREMIEETGVAPKIGKLLFIQQFNEQGPKAGHTRKESLEFFFHIENTADYETIDLNATSHGNEEIERCGFIDPSTHPVLPKLLRTTDIAKQITEHKAVAIYHEFNK